MRVRVLFPLFLVWLGGWNGEYFKNQEINIAALHDENGFKNSNL
jgi:hypothetical protein